MTCSEPFQELHEKRELVYNVLDNIPLGVLAFNAQGLPMFINRPLAEMLQVSVKAVSEGLSTLPHSFKCDIPVDEIMRRCQNGDSVCVNGYLINAGGEEIPVLTDIFPLRSRNGEIYGIIGVFQNLRQQLLLERSHQEYRQILDSINASLIAIDQNGIITTCNESVAQLLGTVPKELIGTYLLDILTVVGYGTSFTMEILKTGKPLFISEMVREINGKEYLFTLDASPIRDSHGSITGAVGILHDISLQRAIEYQANRAETLASLGQLAAGTAHEIRNPLTSIRGFVQMLKHRLAPQGPEQEYLDIILEELDRVNVIIKNFLLMSKPQAPKFELQNINDLLGDLLKLVEGEALMSEIQITQKYASNIPLMVVQTEGIKQVFLNLMQNAIQAMPSGGQLTVVTEHLADENANQIKIIDTGRGIPKGMLHRIGQPFFTTRETGTGLGLAVSFKIVQDHKGTITVESEENKGTCFTVKLPVI